MIKNEMIMVLEKHVGTKRLNSISGNINNPGLASCALSDERGSVYGIAVKLKDSEIDDFLSKCDKCQINVDTWKTIGNSYYPLYWGKDLNLGTRLNAHTKTYKSTGSLQLNKRIFLQNKEIIYGAIQCTNSEEIELQLRSLYPDVLKTKKIKSKLKVSHK